MDVEKLIAEMGPGVGYAIDHGLDLRDAVTVFKVAMAREAKKRCHDPQPTQELVKASAMLRTSTVWMRKLVNPDSLRGLRPAHKQV